MASDSIECNWIRYTFFTSDGGEVEHKVHWCSTCGAIARTRTFDNRIQTVDKRFPALAGTECVTRSIP